MAKIVCTYLSQERFKTRAAHFPITRDDRTGMQWATLGKRDSETASQSQGRTARAFPRNCLWKTIEITVVIQHSLTATQSFGSQARALRITALIKVSNDDTRACLCV